MKTKVLEINATSVNVKLVENDFRIREINAKEWATFHNEGNQRDIYKETKRVETTGTKINAESEMESLLLVLPLNAITRGSSNERYQIVSNWPFSI